MHALVKDARTSRRRWRHLLGDEEPLHLAQAERRHGIAVSLSARASVLVQKWRCSAHQQCRAWPLWPQSFKRLGYPGQNVLSSGSKSKLALHPTVKPVALVADAIRDCSRRNGIIVDPFAGAGTTLIAAERTGRKARLIELEPRFLDATIKRWRNLTGKPAVNAATGAHFGEEHETTSGRPAASSDEDRDLIGGARS
jgi:hypothetical protein